MLPEIGPCQHVSTRDWILWIASAVGYGLGIAALVLVIHHDGGLAYDARSYWLAGRHAIEGLPLYEPSAINGPGPYRYPPIFAQLWVPLLDPARAGLRVGLAGLLLPLSSLPRRFVAQRRALAPLPVHAHGVVGCQRHHAGRRSVVRVVPRSTGICPLGGCPEVRRVSRAPVSLAHPTRRASTIVVWPRRARPRVLVELPDRPRRLGALQPGSGLASRLGSGGVSVCFGCCPLRAPTSRCGSSSPAPSSVTPSACAPIAWFIRSRSSLCRSCGSHDCRRSSRLTGSPGPVAPTADPGPLRCRRAPTTRLMSPAIGARFRGRAGSRPIPRIICGRDTDPVHRERDAPS